ncbi:MAG: TetR/AcrR family transcriptional regulator [Candidatus Saccharibacteria bacterium]|nr:TetR/AcrR family transcriptional regulator [Candidatus Saccharibacteria bacterium]
MKVNHRKDKIIDTAYTLFVRDGYDNTSVDEIIANIGIAKGTFYYYFETKEQLLEAVINKLLDQEKAKAIEVAESSMPLEQKLVGVIMAMRPTSSEAEIADALNKPENIVMHEKINQKIIETATPILATIVEDGVADGVFNCTNIAERIKLILIMSGMFDDGKFTEHDIEVFIDTIEKVLGAKPSTMKFIEELIK